MTFRRRSYLELVENLLTAITGGVSAEAHPFPPNGTLQHPLQQPPVASIISVYGSYSNEPYRFTPGDDYVLLEDNQTLAWVAGGHLPDPGTLVHVNYYSGEPGTTVNDIHVGSVLRTLTEATALEVARFYAQLEAVSDSAYVDTATGRALDNVVALLGIERIDGGHPVADLTFTRTPNSIGAITIPAGTRVLDEAGDVEYETTQEVTLLAGQNTIRVSARDLEANDPLPADLLTVLAVPIAGIAGVTNPAPSVIEARDESDEQLRTRAKNFLHGSERATLAAIQHAVNRQGVTADVVEDPVKPGYLTITLHADTLPPDQYQRIRKAVDDVRPAGVKIDYPLGQVPKRVDLELLLTSAEGALEQDLRAAQRNIREKIEDYFAGLAVRENGSVNKIVGLVLSVPPIEDVRVLSATVDGASVLDEKQALLDIDDAPTLLGDLVMADPQLPTVLDITVRFPEDEAPPDVNAIRQSVQQALASLNQTNNADLPESPSPAQLEARQVSYGKLLFVTPLPVAGKETPGTLDTYDPEVAPPDISPYVVTYLLSQQSGLSHTLTEGVAPYDLTPYERLSLNAVQLQPEAGP